MRMSFVFPALFALFAFGPATIPGAAVEGEKLNFLIVTVDDMSCDSIGAFGCKLEGTTPNIDKLVASGHRFDYAHVQVGNCMPSRNVLFSGRYPHHTGVEGFYQVKPIDFPVMCDLMKAGGWFTGIRGKVSHSTPYQPYAWDLVMDTLPDGSQAHIKDVESYHTSTKMGIDAAKAAGKPFCLDINVSDPHKPFWAPGDKHPTSRIFTAEEVPVPGFLPDDPRIREELGLYYSSVRRADDCVGEILRALEESGERERTAIVFLSDHGMPLPFAKTQLYHHSTRTPLTVIWPEVTKPGTKDTAHLVSAVDFLPTLLDMAGLEPPEGLDGKSFAPVLRGEIQPGREHIVKEHNENAGGNRNPMRAVQTRYYLYIFNPWSDGKRLMATATNGTATWRTMKALAREDSAIAERVDLMEHRVVEELYDVDTDPDCRRNLIAEPAHAEALAEMRGMLEQWMVETGDPALEAFRGRENPAVMAAYLKKVEDESASRRSSQRKAKPADKGAEKGRNKNRKAKNAAKDDE